MVAENTTIGGAIAVNLHIEGRFLSQERFHARI